VPLTKWIKGGFEQAIAKTTVDDAVCLTEFWKSYNIRHAIENIHHPSQQIIANNMRGVCRRILPHCANSSDFEEKTVIEEITNTGRELGFDETENNGVQELLNSHSEELTDDDVLLLDQQRAFKKPTVMPKIRDNMHVKELILNNIVIKKCWMLTLTSIEACKFSEMWMTHYASASICMYEDIKEEKTIHFTLLKYFETQ
jgi:hypothetical protein